MAVELDTGTWAGATMGAALGVVGCDVGDADGNGGAVRGRGGAGMIGDGDGVGGVDGAGGPAGSAGGEAGDGGGVAGGMVARRAGDGAAKRGCCLDTGAWTGMSSSVAVGPGRQGG